MAVRIDPAVLQTTPAMPATCSREGCNQPVLAGHAHHYVLAVRSARNRPIFARALCSEACLEAFGREASAEDLVHCPATRDEFVRAPCAHCTGHPEEEVFDPARHDLDELEARHREHPIDPAGRGGHKELLVRPRGAQLEHRCEEGACACTHCDDGQVVVTPMLHAGDGPVELDILEVRAGERFDSARVLPHQLKESYADLHPTHINRFWREARSPEEHRQIRETFRSMVDEAVRTNAPVEAPPDSIVHRAIKPANAIGTKASGLAAAAGAGPPAEPDSTERWQVLVAFAILAILAGLVLFLRILEG